jgi:hypothetical protein
LNSRNLKGTEKGKGKYKRKREMLEWAEIPLFGPLRESPLCGPSTAHLRLLTLGPPFQPPWTPVWTNDAWGPVVSPSFFLALRPHQIMGAANPPPGIVRISLAVPTSLLDKLGPVLAIAPERIL